MSGCCCRELLVEQGLILLKVADPYGGVITVAARVGDEIASGENPRREDLARALVSSQGQNVLCPVAGIVSHRRVGSKQQRGYGRPDPKDQSHFNPPSLPTTIHEAHDAG